MGLAGSVSDGVCMGGRPGRVLACTGCCLVGVSLFGKADLARDMGRIPPLSCRRAVEPTGVYDPGMTDLDGEIQRLRSARAHQEQQAYHAEQQREAERSRLTAAIRAEVAPYVERIQREGRPHIQFKSHNKLLGGFGFRVTAKCWMLTARLGIDERGNLVAASIDTDDASYIDRERRDFAAFMKDNGYAGRFRSAKGPFLIGFVSDISEARRSADWPTPMWGWSEGRPVFGFFDDYLTVPQLIAAHLA